MRINIIGSGNVATHLAKAFIESRVPIQEIFGRNEQSLAFIHKELGVSVSTKNITEADIYIIAVRDSAVEEVSRSIINTNSLVVHTSASLPKEILKGKYRKGCLYPLQTFSKNKNLNYHKIPFFIEAENKADEELLENLANRISKKVMKADTEKRKYIHLTAVFLCNFVNHLYAQAKEIADHHHIPFDYFYPLIEETVDKIQFLEPKEAQTGPAVRNDIKTLKLHENLLENDEIKRKIYSVMNESIKKMYEL